MAEGNIYTPPRSGGLDLAKGAGALLTRGPIDLPSAAWLSMAVSAAWLEADHSR